MAQKCQKVMKSTIETTTHLISSLTILNAYRCARIGQCRRSMVENVRKRFWIRSGRYLPHGMVQVKVSNGIEVTLLKAYESQELSTTIIRSLAGETVLSAVPATTSEISVANFARLFAKVSTPIEKEPSAAERERENGVRPVYNLTVEGAHCYYANGVLVHNCDSVTQAIKHMRDMGLLQYDEDIRAQQVAEARLESQQARSENKRRNYLPGS